MSAGTDRPSRHGADLGGDDTQHPPPLACAKAVESVAATHVPAEPTPVGPLSATAVFTSAPAGSRSAAWGGAPLEIGSTVGRYVVVDFLGAGAMGAVYGAYDPELDRKVALKVLLRATGHDAEQRRRLVREAQALARVQHPHVVAVHDVGEHEGCVFVAMEFVRGRTLTRFLDAEPAQSEIIRVFVDAARGLSAAHGHGLVHRDFKPDNVMIDEEGRVRVMDFGLARTSQAEPTQSDRQFAADASLLDMQLSTTGSVMGTPAYMAPEQFAGKPTDAQTDQFAYCVALFEAFVGTRPFTGGTLAELATNVCTGRMCDDADTKMPAKIRRIVMRGLRSDVAERWPSMDALLAELDRDPGRRRRRILAGFAATAAVVGAVAWSRASTDRTCEGGDEAVAAIWNAAKTEAVARAFTATELPYAETARFRVVDRIDAFAHAYAASHRAACEATEVRHEQSAELMDARMRCLRRRLQDFDATVEQLEHANAEVVERASDIANALPALAPCDDPDYVTAAVPPPDDPHVAARVAEVHRVLASARARRHAGRLAAADELLVTAQTDAAGIEYAPLRLEVAAERSELATEYGEHDAAVAGFEEVFFEGRVLGLNELRADAAIQLVYLHGYALAEPAAGLQWARHADAELRVSGGASARSRLLNRLGSVHRRAGDTDAALASLREALAIETEREGADELVASGIHNNLCTLQQARGDFEAAAVHCQRALDIRVATLGEDHPRVAETVNNLGGIAYARGDLDEALEAFRRSGRIVARSEGEDGPAYARALHNIGAVHKARGEKLAAADHYERALEIWKATEGPRHPDVAMALNNLGEVAPTPQEALRYHEEALAIRQANGGPDHLDVAQSLHNVGNVLQSLGDHASALERFEHARAIFERKGDAESPRLGQIHHAIGTALAGLGRDAEAIEAFERALPLVERGDSKLAATVKLALAVRLPKDERSRALALAEDARATFADHPDATEKLAKADAWLRVHAAR